MRLSMHMHIRLAGACPLSRKITWMHQHSTRWSAGASKRSWKKKDWPVLSMNAELYIMHCDPPYTILYDSILYYVYTHVYVYMHLYKDTYTNVVLPTDYRTRLTTWLAAHRNSNFLHSQSNIYSETEASCSQNIPRGNITDRRREWQLGRSQSC